MRESGGGLDGVLAEGTRVSGTLNFDRAVRIDGRFQGKVESPGKLILGPEADVDAEVEVGELEVHGRLRGRVHARNLLLIRAGGRVEAEIRTGRLGIEAGAFFQGRCEMPEQERLREQARRKEAEGKKAAAATGAGPQRVVREGEGSS